MWSRCTAARIDLGLRSRWLGIADGSLAARVKAPERDEQPSALDPDEALSSSGYARPSRRRRTGERPFVSECAHAYPVTWLGASPRPQARRADHGRVWLGGCARPEAMAARQGRHPPRLRDLLQQEFAAEPSNQRWVADVTESTT